MGHTTFETHSHNRTSGELKLENHRLKLHFLPDLGCHWTKLQLSVKGTWVDFLMPVDVTRALYDAPLDCGSYVLAPWSNRIAGACFDFGGERHVLRKNFSDGTAIHGDARSRPWKVVSTGDSSVLATLDTRDHPDFNFPFRLRFRQSIELGADCVRVALQLENADDRPAPTGFGYHPYLCRRLTPRDDDVILVVPAERYYPATGCIPTGDAVPVSGETDLRGLAPLGNPDLDHCFTGLTADHIRFIYPGSRCEVRFRFDQSFSHVVVYVPRGEDGRPRDFFAVEPVTHVNDGFNLLARGWKGTGVRVLQPGETWGGSWEVSVGDL